MRLSAISLIAGVLFWASNAKADWQYVKWGMTQAQAIAASKGELTASAGDGGQRIMCIFNDQKEMAFAPQKVIGEFTFDVIVCGNNGKVSSVSLRGERGNYNALRTSLLGRYGQPIQDTPGDMGVTTWRDTAGKNLVRLSRVLSSGSVEYRAAGTSSGL